MSQTPNALASLALLIWPLVAFALVRRLGPARGVVATILGGYLLLPPWPAGFNVPLLFLSKDTIPALSALAAVLLTAESRPRLLPESTGACALLALMFVAPWTTVLANSDPVFWGTYVLPPLNFREALSMSVSHAVVLLPMLLGRALLAGEAELRGLLWALLIGGLAYSLPMLVEVRLSPQINVWVYGFFQHSFDQMMRGDGFRPIMFLYHGLWVAFFAMTAVVAGAALLRHQLTAGWNGRTVALLGAFLWMFAVLVLCKSLASLLYALLLVPLVLLAPVRLQLGLAAALALAPMVYPIAKTVGLMPQEAILGLAERAGPERAGSLRFRLETEDVLLARANQRPLFGWGIWNRSQILQNDTGRMLSVPDGRWIIILGVFGWTGLVAGMGLLALPVLMIWAQGRGGGAPVPRSVAALALILAINLVDLLPNATETPLTWLTVGALLGWAERQRQSASNAGPLLGTLSGPGPAFIPTLASAFAPGPARSAPARPPAFETVL